MPKFTDAVRDTLISYFNAGDQPTEAQFTALITRIQEGIELHDHDGTGDGDGIADLGPLSSLVMADGSTVGQAAGPLLTFDDTLDQLRLTGAHLRVGYDTGLASYFGRAAVGFAGPADSATFAHIDVNDAGGYALLQNAAGQTILNAEDGQSVFLRIHNVTQGYYGVTKFVWNTDFGIGVSPTLRLEVFDDVSGYVGRFINDGDNIDRYGIVIRCGADNGAAAGTTYYIRAEDGDGGGTGYLKTVDGVFQLADISDERRKTNIVNTRLVGLDIVNALKVRDYNWKAQPDGPAMTSFVAQEAQKVFPGMVGEDEDGLLMTSRAMLIPILAKAIQELDARLTEGGL